MTEYDRAGLKAPLERRPGCKELSCYMAVNLYLYGKPESPLVFDMLPLWQTDEIIKLSL